MILVTVGTERFDELIAEVDHLCANGTISEHVVAQIGVGQYVPKHVEWFRYDRSLLDRAANADLIISHAGTGSVCECLTLGRPFITVVDQRKVDNHQREFVVALACRYDFCWIDDPARLSEALPLARPARPLDDYGVARLAADVQSTILAT